MAADVANVVEAEELSKIILVGHSFGANVLIGCA
jgi:pimeloyl-ACP methyl ester carboxylesterase